MRVTDTEAELIGSKDKEFGTRQDLSKNTRSLNMKSTITDQEVTRKNLKEEF
jgi:hypothetical protein